MELIEIRSVLPDLSALAAAADAEGHSIVRRLLAGWASGDMRFERPGEMLLAAKLGGEIAGIGGMTLEPSEPEALRMRRFYVLSQFRRRGIASAIAAALIMSRPGVTITVHAGTKDAPVFWEGLGFRPVAGKPYSHVLAR